MQDNTSRDRPTNRTRNQQDLVRHPVLLPNMLTALIAILPIVAGALVELHGEHLQRRAEDPTITLNVGAGVKFLKMSVVYSNEGDRLSWPFIDVSKWPQESPSQWQVQLPPMLDDINRSIDEGPLEGWKRIHVAWRATIGGTEYMVSEIGLDALRRSSAPVGWNRHPPSSDVSVRHNKSYWQRTDEIRRVSLWRRQELLSGSSPCLAAPRNPACGRQRRQL